MAGELQVDFRDGGQQSGAGGLLVEVSRQGAAALEVGHSHIRPEPVIANSGGAVVDILPANISDLAG